MLLVANSFRDSINLSSRVRGRAVKHDEARGCADEMGRGARMFGGLTLGWSLLYLPHFAFPGLLTSAVLEPATNEGPTMRKRKASLSPASEYPALPVLPAQSRVLVRPNC
jgi:hypothetical protein